MTKTTTMADATCTCNTMRFDRLRNHIITPRQDAKIARFGGPGMGRRLPGIRYITTYISCISIGVGLSADSVAHHTHTHTHTQIYTNTHKHKHNIHTHKIHHRNTHTMPKSSRGFSYFPLLI